MKPTAFPLVIVLALTASACVRRDDPPSDDFIQLKRNTEFDGANLRLFVSLDDGTEASVNTADDVIEALPGATPLPGSG